MDLFTCGICKLTFHQLDTFLEHKHKHDFQKQPGIRSGSPERKTEPVDHVFPNIKASSASNSSTSPFLNSVPRMECPSLHKDSPEFLSQVSEYSITPRCTVSSVVVSPHCKSATSKLLDVNTSRLLEVVAPRSEESTCIETGSFEGEDGDVILIEISENKKQEGELKAKVCRPDFEGSEASHMSSITRSEKLLPKNNEEEESISSSCCSGHVNSSVGFECRSSEEESDHIQTHFPSSTSTWEDPADGRRKNVKSDSCISSGHPRAVSEGTSTEASRLSSVSHPIEMCITQSCNVFSTVYGDKKMIAENSRETEKKLVHTSPQGRSWTSDSITYTTPSNVTHTTPAEPKDMNYCQEKLSVNRSDMIYEYAYRDKPKIDLEVKGPCEDIPHESGINSMGGMNSVGKVSKKVVPGDRTTADGELPLSVRSEATVVAGNSCSEEIFVGHQDGSASDGSMTQGLGEGALLNSESMSLAPGDCSELEYTPSPGIYTLILNTDNTFSLVSEGCQVPATQTCNPVFVCWPCQKFAPSQAEILSHISANHPQDLSNINQCMFELSPLSPPHGNNTVEAVQHVNGRKVQRRLGRPRKEELIDQKEPLPVRRKFKVEVNGTLCLVCDKLFPKQRQFDKHRCSVWQDDQLPQDQSLSKHPASLLTSSEGGAEEISNLEAPQKEEAEEEEWQRSATCKPRGRGAEKRKRGRPPKVDQLRGETVDKEAFTTVHLPKEENDEVLLRDRSDKQQPLSSSQSILNSTKCNSDITQNVCPSRFQHIPTLPLFSNPHQKERLHKWIAQTDLSFVDDIIDKVYPEKKLSEKRDAPAMFTCRECKLLFRTLTSCRRHCAKHMTKKAFTCPDCDFATANVGGLYSHYRNHTQNLYACDKCDFRARIKAHYRDHLETHNPCRHICRICQKPYSTSSSLRSHIYLNHRNEEGMKYVWWLRRKNQEQDKKNVVFQCPLCYQLFSELSLANQHLAAHEHSAPQEVTRCEVCGLEPLSRGTLKKHLTKHKVVYICCTCGKPQVTASCLRSHLREGTCSSYSREDSLKLSLLYSYTSSGTLPSLISSKVLGMGPLLQDMENYISHQQLPDTKVCSELRHQMEAAGYRQISELLLDKLADLTASSCRTDLMKIVISTRSGTTD
ncbi:uncharacterized protein LOC135100855 isoform X2 [Scylla paramamosain]